MSATTANSWTPSAEPSAPVGRRKDRDRPEKWGNPVTYFTALIFIAVCIAPVLYIVVGGFRTNSQISTSPAALPHPWVVSNYINVLKRRRSGGSSPTPSSSGLPAPSASSFSA